MDLKNTIKDTIINLLARIKNTDDSKCIFYHDIHSEHRFTDMSTSVELFTKHINIIRDLGFEIVHEITKEKKQISISFDDGFKGIYENVGIINKLKVPITIFVVPSFLDRDNFLTTTNLKEIAKNKFIKIQSHTFTHAELPTLDSDSLQNEIQKSKEVLESTCETEINSICFPKGMFNRSVIKKSSEAGYDKQLVVGHDMAHKHMLKRYGGYGFSHILEHIVPELLEWGTSQKQIDNMLINNPRNLLAY